MKTKVLLCSPYKGNIGGISRWTGHVMTYYNTISTNSEIDLHLFSISRAQKIQANTFILKRLVLGVIDYLSIVGRFIVCLLKSKYDVIHLVSSGSFGLIKDIIILTLCKVFNRKSIIHFRFGRIPYLYENHNWEFYLLKIVFKLADIIIVIDKNTYCTIEINEKVDVYYLPNPVAPEIETIINSFTIERSSNTILFAGHVVPTKGIFELVKATLPISGITVRIVGHASEDVKRELTSLMGDQGDKYLFLGEKSFAETIQEMLSCELFVLPTYTEGFPNVILESMACSCPIITTKVGAIPEMMDIYSENRCGVVVEPKDIHRLTDEIELLMNSKHLKLVYGIRARNKVVSNYSIQKIWNEMSNIWLR